MVTVRHNLFNLYLELQRRHQRAFTWTEIAAGTGLLNNQVRDIIQQAQTDRTSISNKTIAAFLSYFRSQGLDVDFNDIFIEENDDTNDTPNPNPNPQDKTAD